MIERDYSEKRDFIRMKIDTPAKVEIEREGVVTDAICNDLSGSGMSLTVGEEIAINSELLVTLTPDKTIGGPSLQARCSIARCRQGDPGQYILGLEIKQILEEES